MKIYFLENLEYPLDKTLMETFQLCDLSFEVLSLPNDHKETGKVLESKERGCVFLPAVWQDLFCVKIIQEIKLLEKAFETVIVGSAPLAENLVLAFNEGLSAYLTVPITKVNFQHIFLRVKARHKQYIERLDMEHRLFDLERQLNMSSGSEPVHIRNHYLGQAFLDIKKQKGPFSEENIEILIISSSEVQKEKLATLLNVLGLTVVKVKNIEEAIKIVQDKYFSIIISDNVLPDGEAVALADQLRKSCSKVPKLVVWSSSPEKAGSLLDPKNHIDEVVLKPSPETGIESILPTIIALMYQV
ncbi:hypothetical protein MNBD_UNCLBAC01-578 [hydrothermal vent metagenome]|uniref:Response regulatory domain-containing protein n=1 Tax=hydrothermal vent metagenome TaxID=652676 RepID=A0A3B1DMV0_9ZZZZ